MNGLSKRCTNYLINKGIISQTDSEIYIYCFRSGFEMISCFLINFCIACYMEWVLEYLAFMIIFAFTRSFIGGLHFKKYGVCLIASCAAINITIFCATRFPIHIFLAWIIYIVAFMLICFEVIWKKNVKDIYENNDIKNFKRSMIFICGLNIICTLLKINTYTILVSYIMLMLLVSIELGRLKSLFE